MDRAIPPSPDSPVCKRSPVGSSQPPRHPSSASQPRCPGTPSEAAQPAPQSASRYQTPEPCDPDQYFGLSMVYSQPHQGLPFNYTALHTSDDVDALEIVPSTATAQLYKLNTPEASPPTAQQQLVGSPSVPSMAAPQRATQAMKALAVKSGRIEKSSPPKKKPTALSASPPIPRKDKSAKADSSDSNTITEPLSVLTKGWDIPFVDIHAYVTRSAEERREEVDRGKVPGKVKRAMNAFMLYRKAYQDGAKKWAQQSNHQVVSKVCGLSWSMEPDSVRRQFNEWAMVERDNHRKAHPEYKFTPSKPRKKGKDGLDDDSDADDADWENTANKGAQYRSASKTPMLDPHGGGYGYHYATPHMPEVQPYPAYYHRPPQQSNQARHPSAPYDLDEYSGNLMHYRQVPSSHQHQLDSIAYASAAQQSMGFGLSHHPAGSQGFDMGGQYPAQSSGMATQPLGGAVAHGPPHGTSQIGLGQQIDPSLMSRDGASQYDLSNPILAAGSLGENQWQSSFQARTDATDLYSGPYVADVEESYMPDAHLQYLQGDGDGDSWRVNPVGEDEAAALHHMNKP